MLEKYLNGGKLKLEALSAIFPIDDYSVDILNVEHPEKIKYYGTIYAEIFNNNLCVKSIDFAHPEAGKLEKFLANHLKEVHDFLEEIKEKENLNKIIFDDYLLINSN